jgi:hypothetical protein
LLEPWVGGSLALILANLVFKVCDIFFPSSATASLVVSDALKVSILSLESAAFPEQQDRRYFCFCGRSSTDSTGRHLEETKFEVALLPGLYCCENDVYEWTSQD